jgi:hypothetical protein
LSSDFHCDTLDLRAFIALMELSNFRRAADVPNMSQPALSRRIQKLEGKVGAQLFQRTTRQVTPTAIGRELEPLARRLIDEFDASLFSFRVSRPPGLRPAIHQDQEFSTNTSSRERGSTAMTSAMTATSSDPAESGELMKVEGIAIGNDQRLTQLLLEQVAQHEAQ